MVIRGNHDLAWMPNPRANATVVSRLGDEMFAIENHLVNFLDLSWSEVNDQAIFRTEARGISVSLRKLLEESMLQTCVKGLRLHALLPVADEVYWTLSPKYVISYPTPPTPNSVPPWMTYVNDEGLEVHSVPGLRHFNLGEFHIDSDIFDVSAAPRKRIDQWLKQPMLRIGRGEGRMFTLGDVLDYVVHTEGAHWDDYATARHPDSKQFLAEALEFMQTTHFVHYPHFVTVFVGMYLRNLWVNSLRCNGDAWSQAKGGGCPGFSEIPAGRE